jgi:hypothetical protein
VRRDQIASGIEQQEGCGGQGVTRRRQLSVPPWIQLPCHLRAALTLVPPSARAEAFARKGSVSRNGDTRLGVVGWFDMRPRFRRGISERKTALIAYFAANPDAQICDDCIRRILKCQRSTFTEKDIREAALQAGLVKKFALCLQCQKEKFLISKH